MGRLVAWLVVLGVVVLGQGVLAGAHALQHAGECAGGEHRTPTDERRDHPERHPCDVCVKLGSLDQPMVSSGATAILEAVAWTVRPERVDPLGRGVDVPELVRARPPPQG